MPRPRGRTKTARISVNFDPDVYGTLVLLAKIQDVPVAQIIRHAVSRLITAKKLPRSAVHLPAVVPTTSAANACSGAT